MILFIRSAATLKPYLGTRHLRFSHTEFKTVLNMFDLGSYDSIMTFSSKFLPSCTVTSVCHCPLWTLCIDGIILNALFNSSNMSYISIVWFIFLACFVYFHFHHTELRRTEVVNIKSAHHPSSKNRHQK